MGVSWEVEGFLTSLTAAAPATLGAYRSDLNDFVGGMKPVIDAMVHAEILKDDSPLWLEDHYTQTKSMFSDSHLEFLVQEFV